MPHKKEKLKAVEPRKVPVQKRSRERFERILSVALALIVEKGVDTVPMSEIASAAEISVASLYQYFPEKAAIVATLADRFNQEGQDCVKGCFAQMLRSEQLLPALEDMVDGYFEFFASVPGSYAIWQAAQADHRLQQLDQDDVERHVVTISDALQRVFPQLSAESAAQQSRILVTMVGSGVRVASRFPPEEGRAMLSFLKTSVLAPCAREMVHSLEAPKP